MNKIKLVTDSTSDLRLETYRELDVEVISLLVNFGEESFRDLVDIDLKQLYARCENKKVFPKTSSVSPAIFVEVFNKYLDLGYDILYLGIGKELSLTFQAAQMAKKEINRGNIRLVDSANLSSASGMLLLQAAAWREEGKSLDEIGDLLEKLVKKCHAYFAVENLEFLYRGGRVSAGKYFLGTMLRAHPIIKVSGGKLSVYKTPKGKMVKALDEMISELVRVGIENLFYGRVMITHAFADDSAAYIKTKLLALGIPKEVIYESTAGSVIGSHCGPNTIGILFAEK
jgi:DegV family protein with EDD domain